MNTQSVCTVDLRFCPVVGRNVSLEIVCVSDDGKPKVTCQASHRCLMENGGCKNRFVADTDCFS